MSVRGNESELNKKVIVFATDENDTLVLQLCIHLLKMKKLSNYHFHVTTVTQDEDILSNLVVIRELNHRFFLHQTDISSDESVSQTISNVIQVEGKIDALVCQMEKRISASSVHANSSVVDKIFEKNFYSHLRFLSNVVPHMKNEKRGKIILINSYAGIQGLTHSSVFCAARFALNGLLQSVAAEVVSSKISVCILQTFLRKSPTDLLDYSSSQENLLTSEDRDFIQDLDEDLEKQHLLKVFSTQKLATSLKTLLTRDSPDMKVYMNKACKQKAHEKFIDPRGTSTLSAVVGFYLNIDIDEFREETKKKSKLEFVKAHSPFSCRGRLEMV